MSSVSADPAADGGGELAAESRGFAAGARAGFWATGDIAGTGGWIKSRPEDFLVEELPAYEPCGEGEHIYLMVQKRGLTTPELVDVLARHFGVLRHAVGYAGLKDTRAVTRQVVSVHTPGKSIEDFPMIRDDRLMVLWADLHTNKLRPGHLTGNRFSIRIRGVQFADVVKANKVLERLEREGVPNRFGAQRFGAAGCNHLVGRAIAQGRFREAIAAMIEPWSVGGPEMGGTGEGRSRGAEAAELFRSGDFRGALRELPSSARAERAALRVLAAAAGDGPMEAGAIDRAPWKRAVLTIDRAMLRLYVSAFQSAVFNAVLEQRIVAGNWNRIVAGDVAFKHDSGAVFDVGEGELAAAEADLVGRAARMEISPSGPMWHAKLKRAGGEPGRIEDAALLASGVAVEELARFCDAAPLLVEPSRRPLRVAVIAPEVEGGADEHGPFIRLAFELPRGSYATAVLEEVMKNGVPAAGGGAGEAVAESAVAPEPRGDDEI